MQLEYEAVMSSGLPIYLFMDERLVDELWIMLKREALPIERVKEASAKVAGKAKFGFGKILNWLAADISGEVGADAQIKQTERSQYTAFLRSLLLRELLPSVIRIDEEVALSVSALENDDFVQILCDKIELVPLPTLAGFMRQYGLHHIGKEQDQKGVQVDMDKAIAYLDKYTVSDKAFDFVRRIEGDENDSSGLKSIWRASNTVVANALSMSNNDHVLIIGRNLKLDNELIFCVVREEALRRNLGAYTGSRRVLIFGQVASSEDSDSNKFLGVAPITISLG